MNRVGVYGLKAATPHKGFYTHNFWSYKARLAPAKPPGTRAYF